MAGQSEHGSISRAALFLNTLKVIAAVAVISYVAGNFISAGGLDQSALGRMAVAATRLVDDPVTTGSIPGSANQVRLNPCGLELRH